MRPVYLEFCGINSFSETAQINFNALLSGGVFGVFGDTGSGKSTILDSIHFALYGQIDRGATFSDCINYRSDKATVTFDFEITTEGERKTYRVHREHRRKTGGTKASLEEYTENGACMALAEGTRDVNEKIKEIIGLSFEDFKTCIALPQGEFAALVNAKPAERLKLVSRLFSLEKYGERLSKAVNERYYKAEEEVNLVKAKMGENEGGRDEIIAELEQKIIETKEGLVQAKARFNQAEKLFNQERERTKAKLSFDELVKRLKTLQEKLPQMREKKRLLDIYPKAKEVKEKSDAVKSAIEEEENAKARLLQARAQYQAAQEKQAESRKAKDNADYEEKILELSVCLQRVQSSVADMQAAESAKKALDECIAEYKKLENKYQSEDFSAKRQVLEMELSALGEDESLLDYLKHNYKDVLLAEAYGEVRADLRALANKYPETQTDVDALLKKYATADGVRELDMAQINLAFKGVEQKRKELRAQLDALETRRLAYNENESNKKLLIEQGKLLRKNCEAAMQKIEEVSKLGTQKELQSKIEFLKNAQKSAQEAFENAQKRVSEWYAECEKQAGAQVAHAGVRMKNEQSLSQSLRQYGFASEQEAINLLAAIGDAEAAQTDTQAFFDEYALVSNEYEKTDKSKFEDYNEDALNAARLEKEEAQALLDAVNQTLGAREEEYKKLLLLREKYKDQQKELVEKEKHKTLCEELRALVQRNRFLEFIASEYLQEISSAASKTLLSLTGSRYFLHYDQEFLVGDNLDGGNLRAVKTLSGGETFLVSLSLALSLSAAICLKSLRPIEFFFLDEGFGTLDGKLVDTVMDVLGKLSKTFAVGLISHVEELKHRIENKITVTGATETHGSKVSVECY